jgi:predicted permease
VKWWPYVRLRLRSLFRPDAAAGDIEEELRFHRDMEARELIDAGWPVREARLEAARRFGNMRLIEQRCRELHMIKRQGRADMLIQDLRYAVRTLLKNRAFTAVAVITLGLGIGANTAVFSVINTVLLRSLPYDQPEQLTVVWTNFGRDLPQNWISGPEYGEMLEFNTTFEDIAVALPSSANLTGDGNPEQISAGIASANLFSVLRVQPAMGRLFIAEDDRPGAELVAVISDGFWRRRFGGDPTIVGRTIDLDGDPYTVIGILPPGFKILHPDAQFPAEIDVWIALLPAYSGFFGRPITYAEMSRGSHGMRGFGRLKPGVTLAQARADMDAVANAMRERTPDYYDFEGWGLTVYSLHGDLVEEVRPALLVLLGAVGFVLLIAVVNVANLSLARATAREREIAVRTALGAGRRRLMGQLLTESVVLSLIGGFVGLATAFGLVRALAIFAPADLPRRGDIGIDGGVLVFTLGVSLVAGLLFGLAPALHGARGRLVESLKEGGRGSSVGVRGGRARSALVAAEVALAVVLLVGAGLMVKSFARLMETDPGYRTEDLLTLSISLPGSYSDQATASFYDRLITQVAGLPGVESVGAISHLPLSNAYYSGTTQVDESATLPEDERSIEADRRFVSPEYFQTMGVSLLSGRFFTEADNTDAPLVAMVDEEFVKRFWPTEEPIGKHVAISWTDAGPAWREVVGVVRHSKHYNLSTVGREQVYFPYKQEPRSRMFLAVRTAVDPLSLAGAVRNEVWTIDPDQPVADVQAMGQRVGAAVAQPRFNLLLLGGFAVLALALAAVGIYGVISYSVSQRSHEIGVRIALGAETGQVVALVLRQGLGVVLVGLGIGTAAALSLSRLMSSLLFDVRATDPVTYVLVVAGLAAVGAAACYLPARRATRVEPVHVLTSE